MFLNNIACAYLAILLLLVVPLSSVLWDQFYLHVNLDYLWLSMGIVGSLAGCALTAMLAWVRMPRLPQLGRSFLGWSAVALAAVMMVVTVWNYFDGGPNIGLGLLMILVEGAHVLLAVVLLVVVAIYGRLPTKPTGVQQV